MILVFFWKVLKNEKILVQKYKPNLNREKKYIILLDNIKLQY